MNCPNCLICLIHCFEYLERVFFYIYWSMINKFSEPCENLARASMMVPFSIKGRRKRICRWQDRREHSTSKDGSARNHKSNLTDTMQIPTQEDFIPKIQVNIVANSKPLEKLYNTKPLWAEKSCLYRLLRTKVDAIWKFSALVHFVIPFSKFFSFFIFEVINFLYFYPFFI